MAATFLKPSGKRPEVTTFVVTWYLVAPVEPLSLVSKPISAFFLPPVETNEFFPLAHSQGNKHPNPFAARQSEIVTPMIYWHKPEEIKGAWL